jgi:hypothetical protein
MKISSTLAVVVLTLGTMVAYDAADARVGGGKSFGAQRPSIAPRASAPPATTPPAAASQPVMPATPGATLPAKPAMPAAAAPSGASRWLGPIAGIAAGLGLAALLSHFGLPEGMGSFLLLALLAVGGVPGAPPVARRAQAKAGFVFSPGTPQHPLDSRRCRNGAARGNRTGPGATGRTGGRVSLPPGFDAAGFVSTRNSSSSRRRRTTPEISRVADVLTPEMYWSGARSR